MAMIDIAHEKFYQNTLIDKKEQQLTIRSNKSLGHTDFRLMECLHEDS